MVFGSVDEAPTPAGIRAVHLERTGTKISESHELFDGRDMPPLTVADPDRLAIVQPYARYGFVIPTKHDHDDDCILKGRTGTTYGTRCDRRTDLRPVASAPRAALDENPHSVSQGGGASPIRTRTWPGNGFMGTSL
jgi:hypothetical protein